ncbi:hypothetical protein GCK72_011383 [Caenorhabditis remanei]|uniref:F-box domain-containing protein n=1 Tax=Caenorhabditis remanei TaxID=31234 RepID=A0A6A5H7F2_CAERE|nr:hypothetical protein GCK72_011383 [Caenorhabditis remanei]KAF1763117.1 hypothetical protein GCK72_011383 [Caenorhabditis remanei]
MSQPLKLLHLPTLVLQSVLQFLNPIELFELSQCSQRARSIISLSGSRKFKLHMNEFTNSIHVNGYSFHIHSNDSPSEYPLHGTRTFNESIVKISHQSDQESKQKLISFWDNKLVGLKTVFFHLSAVFNCPTENARFSHPIPAAFFMPIIDFIISRQSEINELYVGGENLSDEYVIEIFNKLRVTEHLVLCHQFSRPPSIPFNSKFISIWNSAWITTEHLNLMKHCTTIHLGRSSLTDRDMTSLLNDWKSGQFPNLQYLCIQSNFLSKNFTAFGLPSLRDTVNPQPHIKSILGFIIWIYGGVAVQRDDGVVATVLFDKEDGDLQILVL